LISIHELDRVFPRYQRYDPEVPVWCLTPEHPGVFHRFFDTWPISPSGKYLVALKLPNENRTPEPGQVAEVVLVDLATGAVTTIGETRGWEGQMGANQQWAGDDDHVVFNDVDPVDWSVHAVILNHRTGERRRVPGGVYHVSSDGRYAACAELKAMRRTQTGYGVLVPEDHVPRHQGAPRDSGLIVFDLATGERHTVISLSQLLESSPDHGFGDPGQGEFYGFHAKWSPTGDRLIFTVRWHDGTSPEPFDAIARHLRFAVFTLKPDGTDPVCAVPAKYWDRPGHHVQWTPDGQSLTMNLDLGEGLQFVKFPERGGEPEVLAGGQRGSGHPTLVRGGRKIITDAYAHESISQPEGICPLRWVDPASDKTLVQMPCRTPAQVFDGSLRLDMHPVVDPSERWVVFNGFADGTRRVYLAELPHP
jgi:hypothetical protein